LTCHAQDILVSGTVRETRSGAAIDGADVRIASTPGNEQYSTRTNSAGFWSVTVHPTAVREQITLPERIALYQNYPNPFNPSTRIPFAVRTHGKVKISVFTILGQELDCKEFVVSPGMYSIEWKSKAAAGVLFYSITTDGVRLTRPMVQLDGGGRGGLSDLSPFSSLPVQESLDKNGATGYRVVASSLLCEPESTTVDVPVAAPVDLSLSTIHDRAFVIDLHNDVMEKVVSSGYQLAPRHTYNHTDIPRMKEGGLDAQMFSIYIEPKDSSTAHTKAVAMMDAFNGQVLLSPSDLGRSVTADEIAGLNAGGKIAGALLLEGGYAIQNELANLRDLYARGIRCMTITWNASTAWAVAAADARSTTVGLSEFGKQVIRTMDTLGMIVDVAHTGIKTIEDILATTTHPIIASHSGARALRDHYRNLTDAQIRSIAASGGVIGVVFYPTFLSATGSATLETVFQHIDYIKNLVGVDYVALGSDFDGIEKVTTGLEDVSRFPALTETLLRHGYSRTDVRKILGENFLRVFRTVCK
jgi:membrane dipeptidase